MHAISVHIVIILVINRWTRRWPFAIARVSPPMFPSNPIHRRGTRSSANRIHTKLEEMRDRRGVQTPNVTVVRKFLKGKTHKRGRVETRGRKKKWTRANVLAANRVRRSRIKAHRGARYVAWGEIIRRTRVPKIHRSTASRSFAREGLPVRFTPSRETPQRKQEHKDERKQFVSFYPPGFCLDGFFCTTVESRHQKTEYGCVMC